MMVRVPNKITGANAGGRRPLPMRTRWAARVAQFWRAGSSGVTMNLSSTVYRINALK